MTIEVQLLSGLVESKDVELQTTLELVKETSRLLEEYSEEKVDVFQVTAENEVLLALGTKILEL